MKTADFLLELGVEELPAKGLFPLVQELKQRLVSELAQAELTYQQIEYFVTPRRLAIMIKALVANQPDQIIEKRGPAVSSGFNDADEPTKALLGFARSCGVEVAQLDKLETDKGAWFVFKGTQVGKQTTELLPSIIEKIIEGHFPKTMRWGDYDKGFVRPIHWIVALYDEQVIPVTLLGIAANNLTYGHRFLHPQSIALTSSMDYQKTLEGAKVIIDFAKRKQQIEEKVKASAGEVNGTALMNSDLLDEVTGLVEFPVILRGKIDKEYLQLPKEVLMASLQEHQKCFAVESAAGELLPYFIMVSNLVSQEPTEVISGNERVVTARLADAQFFYKNDGQVSLQQRLPGLEKVVFQEKLGTLGDKVKRLSKLAKSLAIELALPVEEVEHAALLTKTDLLSDMVAEFPELQGVMGYYYALSEGESESVAKAIKEHYLPRFSGDALPETKLGGLLALLDRLDTLVGIFAIGQAPTGSKDPFALRRAALGVIRLLIEKQLPLDLETLLHKVLAEYPKELHAFDVQSTVLGFIWERLRYWYLEEKNIPYEVVNAVLANNKTLLSDIDLRVHAVLVFKALPEAEQLIAANKRVSQLLKKSGIEKAQSVNIGLLTEASEKMLYAQLQKVRGDLEAHVASQHYKEAMQVLATLRPTIDDFFDNVMVMVEDEAVKNNRLALLAELRSLFTSVADISLLNG